MSAKKLRIGLLTSIFADYMSARVYDANLALMLSDYADILHLAVDPRGFRMESLMGMGLDIVYLDLLHLGVDPIVQRNRERIPLRVWIVFHSLVGYLARFLCLRPLLGAGDVVSTPSAYATAALAKLYGRRPIETLPNCVDIQKLGAHAHPKSAQSKKILFLGQLTEEKGLELFLQLAERIAAHQPNFSADIVGPLSGTEEHDQPSRYVRRMQERFAHLLAPQGPIRFLGYQSGPTKLSSLSGARTLVNPSTALGETFGMSNLEAMACGTPVLCSRWSAFPDVVEQDKSGLLMPVRWQGEHPRVDLEPALEMVQNLLMDDALSARLAQGALQSAQRFDHRVLCPAIVETLAQASAERAPGPPLEEIEACTYTQLYDDIEPRLSSLLDLDTLNFADLWRASIPESPECRHFIRSIDKESAMILTGMR